MIDLFVRGEWATVDNKHKGKERRQHVSDRHREGTLLQQHEVSIALRPQRLLQRHLHTDM
jgi:hypothetical protein